YVLAINLALALLRFAWVWVSLRVGSWIERARGEPAEEPPGFRVVAVMSLAGVRGAITLAGVLALPLALPDGTPFPARDLAVFLAAGVILASLLASSIALPRLLAGLAPESAAEPGHVAQARIAAAEAAIPAVEAALHEMAAG